MLNQVLIKFILGLAFIVKYAAASRIICYQPIPFNSHQSVLHSLTEELARQGHQLVVLTTMPRKHPIENITEIDVHNISYSMWESGYDEATKHRKTFAFPDTLEFRRVIGEIADPIRDYQFRHPKMQALISDDNQRFDLVIVEEAVEIGNILSARFGAPLLVASAMTATNEVFSLVGAETNFHYPDCMPIVSHVANLSFWQNVRSFPNFLRLKCFSDNCVQNVFVEKKKTIEMLFLNVHRVWDYNRPVPIGSVLYMDGYHVKPPRSLPQDFTTFLGNSKHGVVVVSFGSKLRMSKLPARAIQVMADVFSQLPYDVLWKYDAEMPNKPKNVRLVKSLPLSDLLHHPNVKALVSHAGLLSIYEAINASVPVISFPIYGDHWLNAELLEVHGIGIGINVDSLNEKDFKNAIVAVVEDKKYRDNVDRLSRIFSDGRERPLQGAARLVRRLTTRGASHLRSPLADVTFAHFYMLDLFVVAAVCVLLGSVAIAAAVKRLIAVLDSVIRPPRRVIYNTELQSN